MSGSVETHYFGDGHDHGPGVCSEDWFRRPGRTLDETLQQLGEAAFAAYVATGADTDGARTWQELFLPLVSPSWANVLRAEVERVVQERDEETPTGAVFLTREEVVTAHDALLTHAAALEPMAAVRPSVARELDETNALAERLRREVAS